MGERCENPCPRSYSGHWRDWHRGHGCDLDDGKPAEVAPPLFMFEHTLERDLTNAERFTWGKCPACEAPHGEPCRAAVGLQLGVRVDGRRMRDGEGAHLGRLQRAPRRVRLVEVGP